MRRDGHRAARKRNDEFSFCLTLKCSLNFREDFPSSSAYKGWDFSASDKTGFRKSQGKVTPTFNVHFLLQVHCDAKEKWFSEN